MAVYSQPEPDLVGPVQPELRTFFETLSGATDGDASTGSGRFHEQFFSLDPASVRLVTREQLRAALPQRVAMFRSIGAVGTELVDLAEHRLDEQHVFAETVWNVLFARADAQPLTLRSTYLLRRVGAGWEVLVYLNHQDIGQVVNARRATEEHVRS